MSDKEKFRILTKTVRPETYMDFLSIEDISFHFGQSAEDTILLRLFNGRRNGFYIDVGAFHPRKYSNTFLLHQFYGWSGINIDASTEAIKAFEAERPNDVNLLTGVGKKSETLTFHKFEHPARNTFSQENVKRQLEKGDTAIVDEEKIQVAPLQQILKKHLKKNKQIDLLNIDIEGLDFTALESFDWKNYQPNVVLIEDYEKSAVAQSTIIQRFLERADYHLFSHMYDTSVYLNNAYKPPKKTPLDAKETEHAIAEAKKRVPGYTSRRKELAAQTTDTSKNKLLEKIESLEAKYAQVEQKLIKAKDALENKEKELSTQKKTLGTTLNKLKETEKSYRDILQSKSWKITKPLRSISKYLR